MQVPQALMLDLQDRNYAALPGTLSRRDARQAAREQANEAEAIAAYEIESSALICTDCAKSTRKSLRKPGKSLAKTLFQQLARCHFTSCKTDLSEG